MKLRLKQTLLAVALLAAPLAWAGTHTAASADFAGDSRDYTLTVASDRGGNPVPGVGTHSGYCWRSAVTASVDAVAGGYTCTGWTGTGSIPASGSANTTGAIILSTVASSIAWQWAGNPYTVTFDGQGGTAPDPASKVVTFGAAYGALATTAREGHAFGGWYPGTDGTGTEVTAATVVTTAGAHTLYAKWTVRQYTLAVASDHGAPVPGVGVHPFPWMTVVDCQSTSVESVDPGTRYLCTGWRGTGSVPPEGTTTNTSFAITNDSTLVWQWATNHWLAVAVVGEGIVLGGNQWVADASNALLAAEPVYPWLFVGWTGDLAGGPAASNATLRVDGPKSVTAHFSMDADGDGLDNDWEWFFRTDPRNRDTDGDGFDDTWELQNGSDPLVSQARYADYIRANSARFGLYEADALGALAVGDVQIGCSNGTANLRLQLRKSDDLTTWTNAGEAVEWQIPADAGKAFYKVRAQP